MKFNKLAFLLAVVIAAPCYLGFGQSFFSSAFGKVVSADILGATFEIPDDWQAIPDSVMAEFSRDVSENRGMALVYKYGFQIEYSENWLAKPNLLISNFQIGSVSLHGLFALLEQSRVEPNQIGRRFELSEKTFSLGEYQIDSDLGAVTTLFFGTDVFGSSFATFSAFVPGPSGVLVMSFNLPKEELSFYWDSIRATVKSVEFNSYGKQFNSKKTRMFGLDILKIQRAGYAIGLGVFYFLVFSIFGKIESPETKKYIRGALIMLLALPFIIGIIVSTVLDL